MAGILRHRLAGPRRGSVFLDIETSLACGAPPAAVDRLLGSRVGRVDREPVAGGQVAARSASPARRTPRRPSARRSSASLERKTGSRPTCASVLPRAVPVQVVATRPPAAPVVLADRHLEVARAVRPLDRCGRSAGSAAASRRPAWSSSGCRPCAQRQRVQGAAVAGGEAGPVEEDAGAARRPGSCGSLVVELDPVRRCARRLPRRNCQVSAVSRSTVASTRSSSSLSAKCAPRVQQPCRRAVGVDARRSPARRCRSSARSARSGRSGTRWSASPGSTNSTNGAGEVAGSTSGTGPRLAKSGATAAWTAATIRRMRLGVLDIGSNTGHLLVVDAHRGARAAPGVLPQGAAAARRAPRRRRGHQAGHRGPDRVRRRRPAGRRGQGRPGHARLRDLRGARRPQRRRRARPRRRRDRRPDRGAARRRRGAADLPGRTTLVRLVGRPAARVFDIGGGSLEIAGGTDEEPDVAWSMPLGAARLTREHFRQGEPGGERRSARCARRSVPTSPRTPGGSCVAGRPTWRPRPRRRSARWPASAVRRRRPTARSSAACSALDDLQGWIPKLIDMDADDLAGAARRLAEPHAPDRPGALVAEAVMDIFGLEELQICPWALREGVILERLDQLSDRDVR